MALLTILTLRSLQDTGFGACKYRSFYGYLKLARGGKKLDALPASGIIRILARERAFIFGSRYVQLDISIWSKGETEL